jgi:hypothetical protein
MIIRKQNSDIFRLLTVLFLFVTVSAYSQNSSVEMDAYAVAYVEPVYVNGNLYGADVNDDEMRLTHARFSLVNLLIITSCISLPSCLLPFYPSRLPC